MADGCSVSALADGCSVFSSVVFLQLVNDISFSSQKKKKGSFFSIFLVLNFTKHSNIHSSFYIC